MMNADAMSWFKESFRRNFCNDSKCKTDCVLNRLHRANADVYTIENIITGCPYFHQAKRLERIKRMRIQCPELLNDSQKAKRKRRFL